MRNIRTYEDIKTARAAGELTAAEEKLIECCKEGRFCKLGDGTRPDAPSDERTIGADLLRYLILGGCSLFRPHEGGIRLIGAYIARKLVLEFSSAKGATSLMNCFFQQEIKAMNATFEMLNLRGSHLQQGLMAQGAKISGSLFLSDKFFSNGTISLKSAKIGGHITCQKGSFFASRGVAISFQDSTATGFFWRRVKEFQGALDLNNAYFSVLADDLSSWEKAQDIKISGFKYDHIINPGNISNRLNWLRNSDEVNDEFSPQPYTQLAKVLRDMGHDHGARQVLFEKEKRLAKAEKQRSLDRIAALKDAQSAPDFHQQSQQAQQNGQVELTKLQEEQFFSTLWSALLRRLVGYGYRPRLIFYWTGGIILAMAVLSSLTYRLGGMVPNSPVVLLSDEWAGAVAHFNPAEAWVATKAGEHYETFSALAYAADVFIPLVPLGQEVAWAPTTATRLGGALWALNWLVKLSGWFITALGAAAIAGVIRRE